jgi:hypothetical protein
MATSDSAAARRAFDKMSRLESPKPIVGALVVERADGARHELPV